MRLLITSGNELGVGGNGILIQALASLSRGDAEESDNLHLVQAIMNILCGSKIRIVVSNDL
jgi:hypothetical protein